MAEPLTGFDLEVWQSNYRDAAVTDALAIIRGYCRWHIAPSRTETVTLDGAWTSTFLLPSLHVTAVTSVTHNGTAVLATGYEWSVSGVLRLTNYFYRSLPTSMRNVVVQMTHGYDDLPGEVRRVALALADRGSSPSNIRQVGDIVLAVDPGDAPVGSVLTDAERLVLDGYRLPTLA